MTITPHAKAEAVRLAPCPFCGGEASDAGHIKFSKPLEDTWWEGQQPITEAFYCNCIRCGAVARAGIVGGFQTKAEAIERWNARYIEANPAISADDKTAARDTANYAARHWSKDTPEVAEAIRLLRLIAGPEEVDPDVQIVRDILHAHQRAMTPPDSGWGNMSYAKGSYDHLDTFKSALAAYKAAKAQAGYEITPITKQEGDHA